MAIISNGSACMSIVQFIRAFMMGLEMKGAIEDRYDMISKLIENLSRGIYLGISTSGKFLLEFSKSERNRSLSIK